MLLIYANVKYAENNDGRESEKSSNILARLWLISDSHQTIKRQKVKTFLFKRSWGSSWWGRNNYSYFSSYIKRTFVCLYLNIFFSSKKEKKLLVPINLDAWQTKYRWLFNVELRVARLLWWKPSAWANAPQPRQHLGTNRSCCISKRKIIMRLLAGLHRVTHQQQIELGRDGKAYARDASEYTFC